MKKPSVQSKPSTQQKCTFLKKSSASDANETVNIANTSTAEAGGGFRFNFKIDENSGGGDTGSTQVSGGGTVATGSSHTPSGGGDSEKDSAVEPAVNYFKMQTSSGGSDFKFH